MTSGRVNLKSLNRLSMTSNPAWTVATVAIAAAAVTPGPLSSRPMTKTISGSMRGWISSSRGTGTPAPRTMPSVMTAVRGELMPIRCCLARDVRPSLTPVTVWPSACLSLMTSSWTR